MSLGKLDKLTRSFLQQTSNPHTPFDSFTDVQDPTFFSFRVDFYPDGGLSMPDDAYSSGGLFRKSNQETSSDNYEFYDSAAEYLRRIGAPAKQAELEIFIDLLYNIQNKAPWFFQSISGLADLYKFDPAQNFRGKEKVLTIECLESVDMRMSLLADLYRNFAFDLTYMREILPINLRTFNMKIHVLEMRRFNTTFGKIADSIAKNSRSTLGENKQQDNLDSKRNSLLGKGSKLFNGTFDTLSNAATNINSKLGGIFSNLGENSANPYSTSLESAFEAISVQTFFLRDCEFDFYSEAPPYLDTVSVKDVTEAAHRFKIKVGRIQKISTYPFFDYIISENSKATLINRNTVPKNPLGGLPVDYSTPYIEETDLKGRSSDQKSVYDDYRESIFPTEVGNSSEYKKATVNAYSEGKGESDALRKKPLERLLGGIVRNTEGYLNTELNKELGKKTGGALGTRPMGNIYGDPDFIKKTANALEGFLSPTNIFK